MKDTIQEQPDGRKEQRPFHALSGQATQHLDVFTNLEALQPPWFRGFYGFIL